MTAIRVVVVDDHPIFRAGVTHTLCAQPDIDVVGEGCSTTDAVRLAQQSRPDIMMLDMHMPGGGIRAIEALVALCPDVKALMLSGIVDAEQIRSAMQKGAWGYLMKGASGTELIQTVRAVHGGERYVTPALAAQLFAARPAAPANVAADALARLTAREERILALIVEGLSNKEIGGRLELSEKTVKHYLTIILDKLHVRTRVQAALLAYGKG
jgi:two-component system nitrate/nitrite response regulator NarL